MFQDSSLESCILLETPASFAQLKLLLITHQKDLLFDNCYDFSTWRAVVCLLLTSWNTSSDSFDNALLRECMYEETESVYTEKSFDEPLFQT